MRLEAGRPVEQIADAAGHRQFAVLRTDGEAASGRQGAAVLVGQGRRLAQGPPILADQPQGAQLPAQQPARRGRPPGSRNKVR